MYLVKCLIRCLRGCRFTKVFLFIIEHPPDSKVKVYTAPPKLENAAEVPVVNKQDRPRWKPKVVPYRQSVLKWKNRLASKKEAIPRRAIVPIRGIAVSQIRIARGRFSASDF